MTGLREALQAQYAAIFGYGVAGAHLRGRLLGAAQKAEERHRKRRDALLARLSGDRTPPPPAEAAYALPFPVTDRVSAIKLAIHLEERTCAVWQSALRNTHEKDRQMALDALVDTAVMATRWRKVAGTAPTVPLPGSPG